MQKYVVLVLLLMVGQRMWAQTVYERTDSLLIVGMLKKAQQQPASTSMPLFFAHQLMGRPYVGQTLEGQKTERLVVNTRQLDCTTLVETVTALTLCAQKKQVTFAHYLNMLTLLRYRHGQLKGYTSRLHYFTDWIIDNTAMKMVKEVASQKVPFTAVQTINVGYMSGHPNAYEALKRNPADIRIVAQQEKALNGRKYRYIPKSMLNNQKMLRDVVCDGDIIAIVTNKKGLDIAHVGFAEWNRGALHLLNASSIHKRVVLEPMTLAQYMKKHPSFLGIRIVRIKK